MPPSIPRQTLHERTRALLNTRSRLLTLVEIAERTGLSVDFLSDFGRHSRPNASVQRVQTLYEFLSGTVLI
jgi:phage portal protein BeeE